MESHSRNQVNTVIIIWLVVCCLLVFALIVLGGAVRLTGSGLSMVDWKPILNWLPPQSEVAWEQAFDQYKQFPEFKLVNTQMLLSDFKFIYLMEYAHRLLGRLLGLCFALPLLIFSLGNKIPQALLKHFIALFFLGVMQGLMGWYMVKSGLVSNPYVSQYRLTAHLAIAVIIYGYFLFLIIEIGFKDSTKRILKIPPGIGYATIGIVFLMIITGGLVAGTKAGFIYNTFPMMGDHWLPTQAWALSPIWLNFFENPVAVQFSHRLMAVIVLLVGVYYGVNLVLNTDEKIRFLGFFLIAILVVQITLGVCTLLFKVPILLGVLHQLGAMVLFGLVVIIHCMCVTKKV